MPLLARVKKLCGNFGTSEEKGTAFFSMKTDVSVRLLNKKLSKGSARKHRTTGDHSQCLLYLTISSSDHFSSKGFLF